MLVFSMKMKRFCWRSARVHRIPRTTEPASRAAHVANTMWRGDPLALHEQRTGRWYMSSVWRPWGLQFTFSTNHCAKCHMRAAITL
ncbi:hypothetical protein PGIGA_G00257600 [Pangasianodon gigas]|uniref:Uncharacterized protein n=1 Tax=Pangasianodon gigas TaxID=30993 RepID=A0ACC5WUG9_PANGG|nr:hypothetical protein [Pangasianodon gigas]